MDSPIGFAATVAKLSRCDAYPMWTLIPHSVPPFMEILDPDDRDGGGGGYICFACGRSTNPGEPFVCISKLWQVSQVREKGERKMGTDGGDSIVMRGVDL